MKSVPDGNCQIIEVRSDSDLIERFIALPATLYPKRLNNQNPGEERALLEGIHPLSSLFDTQAFLVEKDGKDVGRAALFFYPDQPEIAYLGFFEVIDDDKTAQTLFAAAETLAATKGSTRIVGPMNASFWIGYRMKMDRFDESPYFGEPYNQSYYPRLWRENGYLVEHEYLSNRYRRLKPGNYRNPKYERRREQFIAKGYEIRPPSTETWHADLREVYRLIIELYSSFPGFSFISEEAFMETFGNLKFIVDFQLCRLIYYKGRAVSFAITLPDYGNLLNGDQTVLKILRMLRKKHRSSRYVVLYMGVESKHAGLGPVMVQELIDEISARKAETIGALIRKGKLTQGYASDLIEGRNNYALFSKGVEEAAITASNAEQS